MLKVNEKMNEEFSYGPINIYHDERGYFMLVMTPERVGEPTPAELVRSYEVNKDNYVAVLDACNAVVQNKKEVNLDSLDRIVDVMRISAAHDAKKRDSKGEQE